MIHSCTEDIPLVSLARVVPRRTSSAPGTSAVSMRRNSVEVSVLWVLAGAVRTDECLEHVGPYDARITKQLGSRRMHQSESLPAACPRECHRGAGRDTYVNEARGRRLDEPGAGPAGLYARIEIVWRCGTSRLGMRSPGSRRLGWWVAR